jgi:hypothetical protein
VGERDQVHPDIQEGSTAKHWVEEATVRIDSRISAQVGGDVADLADATRRTNCSISTMCGRNRVHIASTRKMSHALASLVSFVPDWR